MDSGGEVLNGGGQGPDFLGLDLIGVAEGSELRLEGGDVLLQVGKAGHHCGLYLSPVVFEAAISNIEGVWCWWGGGCYTCLASEKDRAS